MPRSRLEEFLDNDRLRDPDTGVNSLPANVKALLLKRSVERFSLPSPEFLQPP